MRSIIELENVKSAKKKEGKQKKNCANQIIDFQIKCSRVKVCEKTLFLFLNFHFVFTAFFLQNEI